MTSLSSSSSKLRQIELQRRLASDIADCQIEIESINERIRSLIELLGEEEKDNNEDIYRTIRHCQAARDLMKEWKSDLEEVLRTQ